MTLQGKLVGVSIGGAPDLGKLGFPQREVQRALLAVCGALVRRGALIAYGGDFRPGGFTITMYRYLAGAYADRSAQPFHHYLAAPVLLGTPFDQLTKSLRECSGVARSFICVGKAAIPCRASEHSILVGTAPHQRRINNSNELLEWLRDFEPLQKAEAFSLMRRMQSHDVAARVAMGGKMGIIGDSSDQYEGAGPGVAEEAILTIALGKPFVPLGAYGGATRDIAIELGLIGATARVPRGAQAASYDVAMSALRSQRAVAVPDKLRERLAELADCDQMEVVAEQTATLLEDWVP